MAPALQAMTGGAARGPFVRLCVLTLVVAASEGLGFVMLVPMLAALGDAGGLSLAPGMTLPALSPPALLAIFVALVAVRALAELLRALAAQDLTVAVVDGLRIQALGALVGAEWRALSGMRQAENRALLLSSVERVGYASEILAEALRAALSLSAIVLAGLAIAPQMMAVGMVAGTLLALLHFGLRRRARGLGEQLTGKHAAMHLGFEEALDALRLVKSHAREERTLGELGTSLSEMRQAERDFVRDSAAARAGVQITAALILAVLVWLAIDTGNASPVVLLPLVALAIRAVPLLTATQQMLQSWAREAPALEAVQALISHGKAHAEPPASDAPVSRPASTIELRDVVYAHAPTAPLLDGVSLTMGARETVALTGASGAGKSTLADILGGLLAPDEGALYLDGARLDPAMRAAWRRQVAYVQQEPVLFTGTVRENLSWAWPEANDDMMRDALARAGAGFVLATPEGLDAQVGEGGRQLSGGERQRIALARALLSKPSLLILDEATSAIDEAAEQAIGEALHTLRGQCAILIVAHRGQLSTQADRDVVLEGGKLREAMR